MSCAEKSKVVIPECLHRVSSSSGFPLKTRGNDSPFYFLRNISYLIQAALDNGFYYCHLQQIPRTPMEHSSVNFVIKYKSINWLK
jgi:hypothetical protein